MTQTRDIEDVYPLSPLQEGLLFHTLEPGQGGLYATQLTCRLRGLDAPAFERAWRTVVNRHPSLRSAFVWKSTQRPLQAVARRVGLPFRHEDWRGHDPAELEAKLRDFLAEDRSREMQPSRAPLMRLTLFRTDEDTYQLVWTTHHLILDGWCRSIILQEVFTLYEAYAQSRDAELPPVRPYRDYVAWLQAQDMSEAEAFWRRQLHDVVERTPVYALPAGRDNGAGEQEIPLSAAAVSSLRSLAQRHRLTPGTIVHGAWALLLFRFSGRRDVVFGTVVSGRPATLEGAESIVGLFANTLPVRVRDADAISAADWLRSVQEELVDQRQHQHSSLAQIQKWSEMGPGQSLFDSLVLFQNYPGDEVLARLVRGLGIEDIRSFEQASYPLTLVVIPGTVWRLQLGYDRRRFSDLAVARLLDHYRRLLEGLTAGIERPLPEISLLSESESAQLLREWNDTEAPISRSCLVHELIAAHAAAAPESPAVVWDGGAWSYGTLDGRANQLARHLRLLGVGPESVVGILAADRSPELLLGILGTLKAGGGFLALDSTYPRERLSYMLADAGCRVLLTQGTVADAFAAEGLRRIALDGDWEEVARQSAEAPQEAGDLSHLAYVFYTSGSTGRPKGVAVAHGAFLSFAVEMARRLRLTASDRMLQFGSPAFDVLVEELFPVWLQGGAVVLQPPETLGTPRSLGAAMERLGVTVAELPAVYWHQWVDELVSGDAALPHSLRLLLLGAEKPSPERLAEWRRFAVPLVYVFGLTETAVTSTLFEVPAGHEGELPIGRPVANTRLYLLDGGGQPAPLGVPGELFIGGDGLARGYLGRPELTAERFVPDPWSDQAGERLYRTGDLARYRVDGNLDFLGRIDDQVKVRGFRIEPGEIEAALRQHPGVREAVVIVREDQPGDRRLVGYFLAADRPVPARELRVFLMERLPDHQVPSALVELASLPVTTSGKVDRRSLPAPEPRSAEEDRFEAPRTETERLLAEIWQGVLGIETVGIHDNFFELGGDSILSIRVASAAHRRGYELSPWQLFEHGTIAGLAPVLTERRSAAPVEAPPAPGPVPLTPIQHWFFEQSLPEPEHWNMPVLLTLREPVAPSGLEAVLARVVERHDALRLRFLRQEDGWCQEVVATAGPLPLGRIDLSALAEEPRRRSLEEAAGSLQRSLDLAAAPLLRAAWFDLGAAGTRLLLVAHHLVVDGVSWHILAEDLEAGCRQLLRGESLDLPPATTPFARWAERLAAHARSGALDGELADWRSRRAASPVPLPVDFPDGANSEATARNLTSSLGADETRALLQEVPKVYRAQVNDLLVAALLRALRDWTGGRRLLVDLEGHGREELFTGVDLSRTVGWFTTLTPLLLELPETGEPGDDLRSVKEQLRTMPGRGLGYGLLRALGGEAAADLRSSPRPEVLFNYMGQIGAPASQPALFDLAGDPIGPAVSPRGQRTHLLEINARIQDGRLEVRWTWGERVHRRATIEALAASFVAHLRRLVSHCLSSGERGYTPSDFPLAAVDSASLGRLAATAGGEIDDLYPLSPMQQGMLFHSLFEPGEGVYIAQFVFELQESVDVAVLRGVWEELLRRHAALRTAFFWEDLSDPLQSIVRTVELPWSEEDWSALPEPQRIEKLGEYLAADRARGFSLSHAPLLRLARLRTGEAGSWLVLSLHQILLDGWSLPLLFEDLFSLYGAAIRGENVRLEDRQPYRRYIEWLRDQDLAASEEYWRDALRGFASPTPLGLDSPDPGTVAEIQREAQREAQGEAQIRLPREATERLLAFARGRQLTYNILLQGAWSLLLSRYSGEEDVVFGAVVSGRPAELSGVESMIGLFINTLPVRARISPLEPCSSWLDGLQRQQIEMHRYEHTPLVDVQRWSEVPAGQPLFSSLLIFQNYPLDRELGQQTGHLGIRKLRSADQTNYPLTLIVQPGAELHVTALYARRRLHGSAVQRMLEHLRAILEGLATTVRLSDLPLLSAAERHQLLLEWNDTRTADADDVPLHELFRIQAAKTPDAVAVTSAGERLTYRELDHHSNLLAAHLLRTGVEPGEPVGICLERSLEMMVGLLGILKAGGAYLPLDPEYPALRLLSLIRNAGIRIAVASGRPADHPALRDLRVIRIDSDWPVIARGSVEALPIGVSPESPAYVIYTSGSTGEPKGAINSHRAVCNRIRWMQETYRLTEADRVLQKTPYSFDVSVWELFWPLVTGARLAMARPGGHRDTTYLRETIRDLGITTLHFVPSMLQAFLEEPELEECVSLKRVLCSGEALGPDLAARFSRQLGAELHNLYGPTEAAVDVTFWACARGDVPRNIPIGRPIANAHIHLLDRWLRPVPCGIPGELYIGGRPVGRGYLGNPALTAERFVPDLFSEEPGARLYRTGDLVRRTSDGALEFLGRLDHQVKIRGFRIELGEIEAALGLHPGVREAAVVTREERPGRNVLIAYFVSSGSPAPTVPMLRGFLEERLPAQMVPALYVEMTALPLSPNGKLDRRALPAPAADTASSRETYAEARTAAEVSLAAIWAEVLGVERVGIHDNFFELGGDSILSILVITRAARAGLKLTPKRLFERPTIAQLAAEVEGVSRPVAEQGAVSGEVSLTPVQHWFLEQEQPEAHHFNQTVLLELKKPIAPRHLDRALSAVVAHHDALRLRFLREERGWRQINAAAEKSGVFSRVDLSALGPEDRERAARSASADLQGSLDLAHGPLLRAALFHLGTGAPDRFLMTIHHLAVDAVSWRILLEDLMTALEQVSRGEPTELPAKTTSFKSWAERLAGHAVSDRLHAELDYWLDEARSRPARLPVDLPGGANLAGSFRSVWVTLSTDETDALVRSAASAYSVQMHEILLAALGQTLRHWLGGGAILLDVEGHGREEIFDGTDLSRTVGWFTTIFPLLLDLDSAEAPGEALKAVKEQVRRVPGRGLGYGLLRYLGIPQTASRLRSLPPAEVLFNYLGQLDRGTEASSLFTMSREITGGASPRTVRRHLLGVDGFIAGGSLEVEWSYSQNLYQRSTIQHLADSFASRLRAILDHCRSPEAGGYTPSDFALADLKQQQLDRLARKYQRRSI
jgi:amino acid adenylation domain-containing protein/non-ribosomal peptide synthase protein (TIGR01720 family)